MKKLLIIYGPPRSATSFMLGALVQHPLCFGSDTNENSKTFPSINSYEIIEKLFQSHNIPNNGYLVVASPKYCFNWKYFNNSSYACKYIYVQCDPFPCVKSMVNHDASIEMCTRSLEFTDCPKDKIKFYREIWDQSSTEGKALLRWHWHVNGIPMAMKKASLKLSDYKGRKKANEIYLKIISYLQIPGSPPLKEALALFNYKKMNKNEMMDMSTACQQTIYFLNEKKVI